MGCLWGEVPGGADPSPAFIGDAVDWEAEPQRGIMPPGDRSWTIQQGYTVSFLDGANRSWVQVERQNEHMCYGSVDFSDTEKNMDRGLTMTKVRLRVATHLQMDKKNRQEGVQYLLTAKKK